MSMTVVRYRARADRADENQVFVEKVYSELAAAAPDGLRYMTLRLDDGVTFVHVASVDTADGTNPLAAIAAFGEFQADLADRLEEGPTPMGATVVGSYRFPVASDADGEHG